MYATISIWGGNSQVWLLGHLGVLNTSSQAGFHGYSGYLDFNVDTSAFTNPQHLLVGLLDPVCGSHNLGVNDTLIFSINISGAGGSYAKTYRFTDLNNAADPNSAFNFFQDKTLDLGTWSSFVTASNKALDLAFGFSLYSEIIGVGLNFGLIAGNSTLGSGSTPSAVSEPASLWLLGSALAGLGVVRRRRNSTTS